MPHIHDLIDFTVVAFIVYDDRVLMIHHKKLNRWLSPGGHIELNQDPEEALFNEIREETGLLAENLTVLSDKLNLKSPGSKFLYTPNFLDIHQISDSHRHVGMVYFLKSNTDEIALAEREHNDIRWFTKEDLDDRQYDLLPATKFYATQALLLSKAA
jgi:8-oxo-dGTP diphosphatase